MNQLSRRGRDALVLSLADCLKDSGSWCGETHLQKAVYILQELTGVPLDFNFILYKHGPFSFDLRDALTAMRADYQLRIQANPIPYGPTLVTTETGKKLQERFSSRVEEHRRRIDFVTAQLGDKTVTDLEQLGTAFYVKKEDESRSNEQVAQRVHDLKPHISMETARIAAAGIDRIVAAYNSSE